MTAELTCICVTYGHTNAQLDSQCAEWMAQTDPRWELLLVHDGANPAQREYIETRWPDKRIKFQETPERRGSYGHPNRLDSLNKVQTPLVFFTNGDNQHSHRLLEISLKEISSKTLDCLLFGTSHNYAAVPPYAVLWPEPRLDCADWCSFVVWTEKAKQVGIKHLDYTGADGLFIQEYVQKFPRWSTYMGVLSQHH